MQKNNSVPRGAAVLALVLTLVTDLGVYYLSRLFATGRYYDLTCALDNVLPFLPWTVVFYYAMFVFWAVNYSLACLSGRERAFDFFCADTLAKLVCLVCFLALPTTMQRGQITGSGLFDRWLALTYAIDSPDNLFPSLHCVIGWFGWIAVRGNERIPKWYRVFSLALAVAICISTLTVRQHLAADVFAGVAAAEGCFLLARKTGLGRRYGALLCRVTGGSKEKKRRTAQEENTEI